MQHHITPRLIPALLAIAFSGAASASGFAIMEQNASGMGNAYAGSAAVAENASTIWYNPAGMTKLQAREVSMGVSLVNTSFEFNDSGSSVGALGAAGNGGDAGGLGVIPNAYLSWQVAQDWYVGLGIGAPFGLKTEYNTPWLGSAHSNSFDIKTMNINPSVAWRANEWLSLGAGFSWQKMDAEYRKVASISAAGSRTQVTLDADDTSWGWNVGALFTLAPKTTVGVSYRSAVDHTLDGTLNFSGGAAGLAPTVTSSNASADIKLPDTFILSLAQGIGDQWEVLADVSWTGWSSVPYVDVMRTSGALNGQAALRLDTRFDDAWRFALGANYKLSDAVKIRVGVAYDQTPVPDAEHRLVSLPDNNRTWLSTGVQWKPNKTSALDVGFAYLFLQDAPINNLSATGGLIKGDYSDSAWILGGQYSMGF